jgi:hypothetical protein
VKCEFMKLCCKPDSRLMTAHCSPANAPRMAFNIVPRSRMLISKARSGMPLFAVVQ